MFENTPFTRDRAHPDVVGYGDIHEAFVRNLPMKTLFNVGSVGNPLDTPEASYAIVEGRRGARGGRSSFGILLARVPYDVDRAIQDAVAAGMPDLEPYARELRTAQYRAAAEFAAEREALRASHPISGNMDDRQPVDCVACIVLASHHVLVEKRASTKTVVPGVLALPGGHVEAGESPEEALRRELKEELGIVATHAAPVCTLLHQSEELRRLHYFAVTEWDGEIQCREAETLIWIPAGARHWLDLDVDRVAMERYLGGTLV